MLRKLFSFLSTPVGISLILALLVIGTASVIKTKANNRVAEKGPAALAVEKLIKKSLEDDTDGDGLKNWEESLYKTDPENPDSDKDGVNDGAEIATNRDPLVEGVGDVSIKLSTTSSMQFNATDRFSQELFVQYIEAKKTGKEITPELSEQIAEELLSKDYTDADVPLISEADIEVIKTSPANLFAYGNSVGKITTTKLPEGGKDELTMLAGIANDTSLAESLDFAPNILRYSKMITELKAITVPEVALSAHVKLINGLITILYAVEGMNMLNDDPVGALSRIPLHQDGVEIVQASALEIRGIMLGRNITFSPSDYGYQLIAE